MIKITVLYPYAPDAKFDMTYYTKTHMPMAQVKFGDACKRLGAELGKSTMDDSSPPPFKAIGYMIFDSLAEFRKSWALVGNELLADIPNYTDIAPSIMIGDVTL